MDITFNLNKIRQSILFVFFFSCLWFWLPFVSGFGFLFLLYQLKFGRGVETFLLLLVAVSFGLVAYTTQSVGTNQTDIARYYYSYGLLSDVHSLSEFLLFFLLEGGNLIFEAVNFVMSRFFPGTPQVLPLFWVTITYFFSFLTIRNCSLLLAPDARKKYLAIIFFACIAIIPFYTCTEIVKQVSSVAIFGYAVIRKIGGQRKANAWLVVSCLVHLSSLILLPAYFLCNRRKGLSYMPFIFLGSLGLSFFNLDTIIYSLIAPFIGGGGLAEKIEMYQDIETWSISLRFYSIFFIYFLMLVVLYYDYYFRGGRANYIKGRLLVLLSVAFCILLINRGNVHNFVRYIFGFFPFYAIAIVQLISGSIMRVSRTIFNFFIICFYLYSNVKLLKEQTEIGGDYDNSYMGNNVIGIATSNVVQFLQFKVDVE
jgi:hypothetical protein